MQHGGMSYTVPVSKRGALTIPPALRRKLGIDKVPAPLVVLSERDGGLFVQFAAAVPVRDIPRSVIEGWVREDQADAAAFRKSRKPTRRRKAG
jgi:bifunctional DNA-binding transcriptional regulator/antitoxin component of YhaV-PrlF toxin-antitoxin module